MVRESEHQGRESEHQGKAARCQLNQPTPPPERSKVVVQRQQLKRLENCAQRDDGWLAMKSKRGNGDVFNPSELLNENKK
jgi:hypothetical protein